MNDKLENWASKPSSSVYEKCSDYYPIIEKAFENRVEADELIADYWDIYNATVSDKQTYQGASECYVPVVRDALVARCKRGLRQLFPQKIQHVEAVGTDSLSPYPQLALLEHYIRTTNLKSVVRSMLLAGDITGQWNLYVDWMSETRHITGMIRRNPTIEGGELVDLTEEVDEEESEEITEQGPTIVDFPTEDLVVIPPTVNDIEKADITCIKLRMSKNQVVDLVDKGVFVLNTDGDLSNWVSEHRGSERSVADKKRTSDAGIKTEGTTKYALIYEAHIRLKFPGDEHKSLAYVYYAGENEIVGIIKAPQWGQKRPVISAPVDRISGSFNGISRVEAVKYLQWNLNDFWNMGLDSAMYSLNPVMTVDPEKNPNYAMMVIGMAAVWPVAPDSIKMQSFPALWKDSMQLCAAIKAQIYESLEVHDLMMGRPQSGKKGAQVVGAQQQESSVSVIDHAERFEESILNPLMERFFEYDCQFRDEEVVVLTHGDVGMKSVMQTIPPMQWGERYYFQWTGTAFVMTMQRMQQQIATMNVLRGIPPQQLNGRRLDITPILQVLVDNVFGIELGGQILIDDRVKYTVPPDLEDEWMTNGMLVEIHEGDDDLEHLQQHSESAKITGDLNFQIRTHMMKHQAALQMKRQKAIPVQEGGAQGVPGGAAAGVAGTPRMGAQPAPGRPMTQPPGAVPQQNMAAGGAL